MNKQTLVTRYLQGAPLDRGERSALAKQLKSATKAMQAISMAKQEAAKACHDWQPAEPTVGWVAYCYAKWKRKFRVYRDGEIVAAFNNEAEARRHSARLSTDVNAEWRGMIPEP